MSEGTKDFVLDTTLPAPASLLLGSAKTFVASTNGYNGLQLNFAYTRSAGTALTFTFEVLEPSTGTYHVVKKVDISSGTVSAFSLVYTTSSTENFSFTVPITGYVRVTVTGTATTNSDILVVVPHLLIVS